MIALDTGAVRRLAAPVLDGRAVTAVEPLTGGLINRVSRVSTSDPSVSFVVRMFSTGTGAFDAECRAVGHVRQTVPAPEILMAERGSSGTPPYIVYRWIDGIMLNTLRQQSPASLDDVAEPIGRLAAAVAAHEAAEISPAASADGPRVSMAETIETIRMACERLQNEPVRGRLGAALADAMLDRFDAGRDRLLALGPPTRLAHGDFGGRNILVAHSRHGWNVSGLLDWEDARAGWALTDIGHLFRYSRRYSPRFRASFEQAYRDAGGSLPEDWWAAGRLLDACDLVEVLATVKDLPDVIEECRQLIADVVRDRC